MAASRKDTCPNLSAAAKRPFSLFQSCQDKALAVAWILLRMEPETLPYSVRLFENVVSAGTLLRAVLAICLLPEASVDPNSISPHLEVPGSRHSGNVPAPAGAPALTGRDLQSVAVHGAQLSACEHPHSRDIVGSPGGLKGGVLQLLGASGSKHLSRVNQPLRLCRITSFENRQDGHQRSQCCSFKCQATESFPCKSSAIWSAVLAF